MSIGRKLIRAIMLISIFTLSILISVSTSFADGSTPENDWRLSGVVTTYNKITEGDRVTYSYEIENIGNASSYLYSPIFVYTPAEFTFSSYSVPANFECNFDGVISANDAGSATYLVGRSKNYCYPSGIESSEYIYLDPGESTYFEITGTANADYTISSTAYSMYIYEIDPELIDPWQNGENIWETNSTNAVGSAAYPYGVAQSQVTTTTAKTNAEVQGNQVEVTSGDSGGEDIGRTGSAVGSSDSVDESQAKANKTKAADIRDPKQKGVESDKPASWSEIFDKYKLEILVGSTLLIASLSLGTILFRKHRRKTQLQREYNHALALLKHRKNNAGQNSDEDYKPQKTLELRPETSVKRTKIHGRPVEMDSNSYNSTETSSSESRVSLSKPK